MLIAGLLLNRLMLRGAQVRGPIQWGKISVRGMISLLGIAAMFTWVMGLMGYIRSAGRLGWHVKDVMADLSPWAFTPPITFVAKMVTINMVLFWGSVFVMFWLATKDRQVVRTKETSVETQEVSLVQNFSREESV